MLKNGEGVIQVTPLSNIWLDQNQDTSNMPEWSDMSVRK